MNEYYIYITTNNINGKQYIGQHKGEPDDSYLGSGTTIKKAVAKYGKENFSKKILCYCQTREEANEKEKEIIAFYNAVDSENFYNIQEGGTNGDGWRSYQRWCKDHPEEAKKIWKQNGEKLQKWRKEHPEEYYEKCIIPFVEGSKKYWKEHPEEQKELMKKVNTEKEKWQQTHTEEHQKQVERWRKAGSEANSQRILCVTTGEIFPSQCEAARAYNIQQANISKCLKGERKSAGKHPQTKAKLVWRRLDD